jgi:hypothetical protein
MQRVWQTLAIQTTGCHISDFQIGAVLFWLKVPQNELLGPGCVVAAAQMSEGNTDSIHSQESPLAAAAYNTWRLQYMASSRTHGVFKLNDCSLARRIKGVTVAHCWNWPEISKKIIEACLGEA